MEVILINDMRAPDFGAQRSALFQAAIDMAEWADDLGFDVIGLGEHHQAEDGYNPSPLVLASAMAARTRRIRLRTAVLLASCYDPVRLAEDVAVLQIIAQGRFELGLGFGYRPKEFAMYGRRAEDRFDYTCEVAVLLKRALTGEPFEFRGRPALVSPVPEVPVPVLLGGMVPKVARAAAEIADGFLAPLFGEAIWQPYRDECLRLGKVDPGDYPKQGPTFLWVSEEPEREWEWLMPHILHVADSYQRWTSEAQHKTLSPYSDTAEAAAIRESPEYQVLTPDQTIALVEQLGDNSSLYLTPLFAGAPPERGWKMLELFKKKVWPHVPRGVKPAWGVRQFNPG